MIQKTFLAVLILLQPVQLICVPNLFRKKNAVKPELFNDNDPAVHENKRLTFQQRLSRIHVVKNDDAVRTPVYMQIIGAVTQSAVRAVQALTARARK